MAVATGLAAGAMLVAAAAIPAVLLDLLTRPSGRPARAAAAIGRRLTSRRHAAEPVGPPIEALSTQLRRLSAVLTHDGPVSAARRFGVERVYDETLALACAALGVPHQLAEVDLSDRGFERLRVESILQERGLVLRAPRPQPTRGPRRAEGH